jgi:hypothetical protein
MKLDVREDVIERFHAPKPGQVKIIGIEKLFALLV